jgi:hypothetical protein
MSLIVRNVRHFDSGMSRREMDDEGLPWSSLKRKSDKYAKNGEEMMDILVDDIDRYEQLSNREELLALAGALAGNLIKYSVSSNVTTLCLSCRTPSSFDVSTLSGSIEFCV